MPWYSCAGLAALLPALAAAVAWGARDPEPSRRLDARVDANGDVTVSMNGDTWFETAGVFVRSEGDLFASPGISPPPGDPGQPGGRADLKLVEILRDQEGMDSLGEYTFTTTHWEAGSVRFQTEVRVYGEGFVVFAQHFPDGLNNCSSGDENQVISSFPSLRLPVLGAEEEKRGFLAYAGNMIGAEYHASSWNNATLALPSGIEGSGPLVVFSPDMTPEPTAAEKDGAVVVSPLSSFMSANQALDNSTLGGGAGILRYGIMGRVTSLPKGYSMETIMVANKGFNQAMYAWGELLLTRYGKDRGAARADLTTNYLGYSTDNGAWYYWNPEPNASYTQTLNDVKAYAQSEGLPYRHLQIDSWWYYQDTESWGAHGVKNWTAPGSIFPTGIDAMYNETGYPLVAHNRFWSNRTDYAKQNGGDWEFCFDDKKSFPLESGFWEWMLGDAKKWGLHTYEQDWLFGEFEQNHCTLESATNARMWLMQMGAAAEAHSISIQYCMAWPRFLLQSVEIQSVTQARASDDYTPGNDQWKIGVTSIFAYALGVTPLKDSFWSNSSVSGRYGDAHEPFPRLQAAVSTLSSGSVLPSDEIGTSDVNLIMRSCRKDGLLLRPDRPAMKIDAAIASEALSPPSSPSRLGEIWAAHSEVSSLPHLHVLSIDSPPLNLTLTSLLAASPPPLPGRRRRRAPPSAFLGIDTNAGDPLETLTVISEGSPLALQETTRDAFELWALSPTLGNGWTLLGEAVDKWVPVSNGRFSQIRATSNSGLSVVAQGQSGEVVHVYAAKPGARGKDGTVSATCTLAASGSVKIVFPEAVCVDV